MKSIFKWDEYEKDYEYYLFNIYKKKGEFIKTNTVTYDELDRTELEVGESFYLEDEDCYLTIEGKAKTNRGNIIYKCSNMLVVQADDKERRDKVEREHLELVEKRKKEEEQAKQSIWSKLCFWR